MTTIILVAIGIIIALVAAIMIFFYGGDAFSHGRRQAEAGRLVSESVQMEHAVTLFESQEGHEPGSTATVTDDAGRSSAAIGDLVSKNYLPKVPPGANQDGTPKSWTISYANHQIESSLGSKYESDGTTLSEGYKVCVEARRQLKFADPDAVPQCSTSLGEGEPCCIR